MHANAVQRLLIGVDHPEDADRAGEGARAGDDVVRRRRDPITARCRHTAHGNHHWFSGGAYCGQFGADHFRSADAAPWAVNPEDNRFDRRIQSCLTQFRGGGVTPNGAWRLRAVHDRAVGEDHGNFASLIWRRFWLIVIDAGGVEIVRLLVPTESLDQLVLNDGAGSQLIHQFIVQRVLGGIATGGLQAGQHARRTGEQLLRGDLTVGGYRIQVVLPQPANPAAVGLTGGR
ncbi:hypothetical protein D3C72_1466690 [compost metagenome]